MRWYIACALAAASTAAAQCLPYDSYASTKNEPYSTGRRALPYKRPIEWCRNFYSPEVEQKIQDMAKVIKDPDLYRLFENAWPNTLDTTIRWRGFANNTDQELTFVITGDIDAMWLRDSANQLRAYLPMLTANDSTDSLASLWRGAINLQARYLIDAPYCNAFQAPEEAGMYRYNNKGTDQVTPYYDAYKVFSCDYELDSLASFLQLASEYVQTTGDYKFFAKYDFADAIKQVLRVANEMMTPTYGPDGAVIPSPFTFTVLTRTGGAPINGGAGSPVAADTGLVRSFFRPSDDACIFQFLIPSNMMFCRYLMDAADILMRNDQAVLAGEMVEMSKKIKAGIEEHAVFEDKKHGKVYAYEVDGFGSSNQMDDANMPSLLSMPLYGYAPRDDPVYQNTRRKALGRDNPYYAQGKVISGVGGPHTGPGKVWPMSLIGRILTSDDDDEIVAALRALLETTDGQGLLHESINSFNAMDWSRSWFSWMILDLEKRKPHILAMDFQ